jgi:hypothetical protein
MKKVFLTIFLFLAFFNYTASPSYAVNGLDYYQITQNGVTPIPCGTSESRSCPKEMLPIYEELGEPCAQSFEEFSRFPTTRHFWIEDPEITAQGKANERARQFIYWAVNNRAIDDHPVLREIWGTTSSVAFFFVVIVAAFFGIGFIVSRKTNFQTNIQLWPTLMKLGMMLLYIALSASIVLLLIQLSEIMMRFFIDNLGGKDLFNIYFSNTGSLGRSERNYTDFVGCRDLNLRVQEPIDAKIFLYKMTNITYYIMGTMIILRKILLWFLLFVAPFLAILMPFVFVRNVGWIWIGVFFQWLMYGPLFALFLGALSKIWKAGIPFTFDFSRVNDPNLSGYTYPTAMNILYGGPAQIRSNTADRSLSALNSGSYVDTFTEYVITLIMLWAVTFFPWWLLRIFRDYCCDGIYAMKNVLFAMYDQMRGGPPKGPSPIPKFPDLKSALKIPESIKVDTSRDTERKISIKLESMEQIRKASTTDISKALNMHAVKLTDIAKMEANKTQASALNQKLAYLSNPAKAQTAAERQQFMNLRTELFNRAIKQDTAARNILSSTSSSSYERTKVRTELIKDITKMQTSSASNTRPTTVTLSKDSVASISQMTQMSSQQTKDILQAYNKSNQASLNKAVQQLSRQFNVSAEKIRTAITTSFAMQSQKTNTIMTTYMNKIANSNKMVTNISNRTGLSKDDVRSIVKAYVASMDKPANQVVNNITNITKISEDKVKGAMTQMAGMFYTKNLITDFSSDKQVEEVTVEAAIAKAAGTATGDSPEVGGPAGGPPEQPTKTEKEVEVAAATGTTQKEAEVGATDANGPAPQPTGAEAQLAQQVAEEAMKDEQFIEQNQIKLAEKPEEKPAVVRTVIHVLNENAQAANEVAQEVAKEQEVAVEEAAQVVQEQLEITAEPEKNIEKIVEVPKSISIEEYEELKQMWAEQYESGEIPVTENITSRDEWVEQDIVTITNVMNKILSPNAELQQQGLDELGFIIPIFMINNLKGEQLITYLKAKLEAAKSTKKLLEKEKEIRDKMKEAEDDEENLVSIKKKKKAEAPKMMEMDLEQPKDRTIEEIGTANDEVTTPRQWDNDEVTTPRQWDEVNPAYQEQTQESVPATESTDYPANGVDDETSSVDTEQSGGLKEYGAEESNGLKEYGTEDDKKKEW